jgi:hypothetical protein
MASHPAVRPTARKYDVPPAIKRMGTNQNQKRNREMRLISWNVQSLRAGPDRVVAELMRHRPDIVALQEFRAGVRGRAVAEDLTKHGLPFRTWNEARPGFCSALFARPGAVVGRRPPSLAEPAPYWCEIELKEIGVSGVHIPVPSYKELRRSYWERPCFIVAKSRAGRTCSSVI